MVSRVVELAAAFQLRDDVLKYVDTMNIKTDFSIEFNKTLENIGLGGVKIILGNRVINPSTTLEGEIK